MSFKLSTIPGLIHGALMGKKSSQTVDLYKVIKWGKKKETQVSKCLTSINIIQVS